MEESFSDLTRFKSIQDELQTRKFMVRECWNRGAANAALIVAFVYNSFNVTMQRCKMGHFWATYFSLTVAFIPVPSAVTLLSLFSQNALRGGKGMEKGEFSIKCMTFQNRP